MRKNRKLSEDEIAKLKAVALYVLDTCMEIDIF